jgi:peroxiredoxin
MHYRKGAWLAAALCVTALGVVTLRVAGAQDAAKPGTAPAQADAKPALAEIDRPFKDFTLRNIAAEKKGETISLSSFKGKKAVVAIFMANQCGTTWTYEERMGQLLKDYGNKDVAIVAIHGNYRETDAEIMGQIEQRNLAMPVLDDKPTQDLVKYVDARSTPTFLVIDKEGVLRYKGAYNKLGDATTEYLRPALDAVLAGKEVAVKTSRAFG